MLKCATTGSGYNMPKTNNTPHYSCSLAETGEELCYGRIDDAVEEEGDTLAASGARGGCMDD